MNGGSPRRWKNGFTIVEVIIVLGVTSALFMAAVLTINGKQRNTSFNQSIRNIQSEIQQIYSEVGSGYFQNDGKIACVRNGSGRPVLSVTATAQGSNKDCLMLGKLIQFGAHNSPVSTDPEEYNIYTIIGLRGTNGSPVSTLVDAKPRLIASGTALAETGVPNVFETKRLQYGLSVSKAYYNANPNKAVRAVGFVSNINSLGNNDGSQAVDVIFQPTSASNRGLGIDKSQAVNDINANLLLSSSTTTVLNPTGGVQICFNGGNAQSGLITIGAANRQNSVDLKLYTKENCL